MFKERNPTFSVFNQMESVALEERQMTIQGTVWKTGVLALLVFGSGFAVWVNNPPPLPAELPATGSGIRVHIDPGIAGLVVGGAIAALLVAMVVVFKPALSGVLAPVYAVLEGAVIGAVSVAFEASFPGIVVQALGLTAGTLVALLAAYTSGLIKPSENFKLGVIAATGGVFLVYLAAIVLGLFGISMPLIHDTGWAGITFSAVVVVIAALNLVLDFDFIEEGAKRGLPRYMEWYGAFSLMVTLIWLYLELLKLLAKARSNK